MSGPSDKDRDLDAYLRGDSPLSKTYREEAKELPPAHVDAQILAEAHRADAGHAKPRARGPFSATWMVPASVTAVVVLAVSVAVLLPEGRPGFERQRDRFEDAAPAAETPVKEKLQQQEPKQAPAATYAPPPPRALQSDEATSGRAPQAASPPVSAEPAPPALEQRSMPERESAPVAPADLVRPDAGNGVDLSRKRSAAPGATGAAIEEGVAGSAKSESVTEADAWLARIENLIARGELDAARESLADFRRIYPEVEVPQAITEALANGGN